MSIRRNIVIGFIAVLIVGFVALQLVPGYARTNPPVTYEILWDSPETEQLIRTACYDCHSNETVWPWYAHIAPVSWLVVKDVNEGRDAMNLSEGTGEIEARDMVDEIQDGDMPLPIYLPLHPEANLTAEQRVLLIAGIRASADSFP